MTENDVLAAIEIELTADVFSELTSDNLTRVIAKVRAETGWVLPVTEAFKEYWYVQRCIRHLFFVLATKTAPDFKYKQISLEQPFAHYKALIQEMDAEWEDALEKNPEMFPVEVTDDSWKMFGMSIGNGFVYDDVGRDLTYMPEFGGTVVSGEPE